jgi:S-DNA-T family DNA segregation ATPase FtsK/SpoIIIE
MGKTFTLRELLLIAGMDPRVRVIAWDGKGTGDLSPLAAFLHGHIRGARVDDMTNIYLALNTVRELIIEMGKRADFLASLPFDEAPESKVTSELADKYPDILGPIFFGIDETQSFFSFGARSEKEHKEIRVEIRDSVIELMRLGPALGIWVAMATQTVRDSTIPTEAAAVAVYRYGLKMESHEPNDRVLGTGAHKQGVSATMFGFEEKGIGWFKGEGAKPFIARSVVGLDAVAARVIASRIRQARLAMNLLTGDAAGDLNTVEAEVVYDIVADAAFVMRQRERGRAQWVELVPWLKDLRPAHYADLTEEELSARIRSITGRSRDVRSGDFVKKGTFLSDLRKQENEDEA